MLLTGAKTPCVLRCTHPYNQPPHDTRDAEQSRLGRNLVRTSLRCSPLQRRVQSVPSRTLRLGALSGCGDAGLVGCRPGLSSPSPRSHAAYAMLGHSSHSPLRHCAGPGPGLGGSSARRRAVLPAVTRAGAGSSSPDYEKMLTSAIGRCITADEVRGGTAACAAPLSQLQTERQTIHAARPDIRPPSSSPALLRCPR